MLRLKDTSLVFPDDILVFRITLRAVSPKGRIPWETTATTVGTKPLVAVQLDKQYVKIINVDHLHQGSRGAVMATIASWVRHSELRESQDMVSIFPGNCTTLLRHHGAAQEHISARDAPGIACGRYGDQAQCDHPLLRSLDSGLDVVNVATAKGTELYVDLDPRWAEPDTLKN